MIALDRRRLPLLGVLVAGTFSRLGNAIAGVALPWCALSLTGSAAWTGAAAAAGLVPMILGAFLGGAVLDRQGARRVAIAADLTSAASIAAIALLLHQGGLGVAWLIALIAVGALLDGPGMSAPECVYPELARLGRIRLEKVTAADELLDSGASIIGPPTAGIAIALIGIEGTLALTAVCSLMAACVHAVSLPRRRRHHAAVEPGRRADLLAGIRFLLGNPLLRSLLALVMVLVAAVGALDAVVMPVVFMGSGGGATGLGVFLAAFGAGSAAGAGAFAAWGHRVGRRAILLTCLCVEAAAVLLLALDPGHRPTLLAGGAVGLGVGPLSPLTSTVFLRLTPAAVRGRVLGASTAVALAATPLAVLLAGILIEVAGTRALLLGVAGLLGALALWASLTPALRGLDGRPAPGRGDAQPAPG